MGRFQERNPGNDIVPVSPISTPSDSLDNHRHSDVDSSARAQHHTLGTSNNQAAPGRYFKNFKHGIQIKTQSVTTDANGDFVIAHKFGEAPQFAVVQNQTGNWLIFRVTSIDATNVTFRAYDVVAGAVFAAHTFTVKVLVAG